MRVGEPLNGLDEGFGIGCDPLEVATSTSDKLKDRRRCIGSQRSTKVPLKTLCRGTKANGEQLLRQ